MSSARRRPPRRKTISYSVLMKIRGAYLAGMGKGGREIADAIGVSDPQKVRLMLRAQSTPLLRSGGTDDVLMLVIPRQVSALITEMAMRADAEPAAFAARVLTTMVRDEAVMLANILDLGASEDA